jgi:hypothetical protein
MFFPRKSPLRAVTRRVEEPSPPFTLPRGGVVQEGAQSRAANVRTSYSSVILEPTPPLDDLIVDVLLIFSLTPQWLAAVL